MQFELLGPNRVYCTPGGYYNLNQNNPASLSVVKLHLLQAHIECAINHIQETGDKPSFITSGDDIMKLADNIFSKYQKDIETGNQQLFEQKDVYVNKNYDYLHPNKQKDTFVLVINRSADYSTFEDAEKAGAVYSQEYSSMDEVHTAIKGALQASKCINDNQSLLDFRVNGEKIDLKFRDFERKDINEIKEVLSKYNSSLGDFVLDGWKSATEYSTGNIHGAVCEKRYGGGETPVYQMTIAELEGKYIPYHGGVAMPECETIIQAAQNIDNYYNTLAPEHKYSEAQMQTQNIIAPITIYPALSPTEQKELSSFTTIIKHHFPEANPETLHRLCTIARDMTIYTIQNERGTLSNEKYNSLTDNQEKQVTAITAKVLPGAKALFSYNPIAPAIKLNIPSSDKGHVISTYNVPEIPKNKLAIEPVPTKTATEIVSKKR